MDPRFYSGFLRVAENENDARLAVGAIIRNVAGLNEEPRISDGTSGIAHDEDHLHGPIELYGETVYLCFVRMRNALKKEDIERINGVAASLKGADGSDTVLIVVVLETAHGSRIVEKRRSANCRIIRWTVQQLVSHFRLCAGMRQYEVIPVDEAKLESSVELPWMSLDCPVAMWHLVTLPGMMMTTLRLSAAAGTVASVRRTQKRSIMVVTKTHEESEINKDTQQ